MTARKQCGVVASRLGNRQAIVSNVKKSHRFRPGTVALREIRKFQMSSSSLIPYAPFLRLLRAVCGRTVTGACFRWSTDSVHALRDAAEFYLVDLLSDANSVALFAKRVTVGRKDLQLVIKLRGNRLYVHFTYCVFMFGVCHRNIILLLPELFSSFVVLQMPGSDNYTTLTSLERNCRTAVENECDERVYYLEEEFACVIHGLNKTCLCSECGTVCSMPNAYSGYYECAVCVLQDLMQEFSRR